VRRDIDRLRDLGYPVDASPGAAGGYRLGTGGAAVPPLLLDDEEAVAVAISLHSATTGSVAGLEETALRALTKLQAMLPSRLRHKITAFHATTLPLTGSSPGAVDPELLTSIAAACRDQRQLGLRYQGRGGVTTRNVEPHRLVHTTHRWYLLAWDTSRGDWRTFRLDRIQGSLGPPGARFTPRPPPSDDAAAGAPPGIKERFRRVPHLDEPARRIRAAEVDIGVVPLGKCVERSPDLCLGRCARHAEYVIQVARHVPTFLRPPQKRSLTVARRHATSQCQLATNAPCDAPDRDGLDVR
jgi:WYL domain